MFKQVSFTNCRLMKIVKIMSIIHKCHISSYLTGQRKIQAYRCRYGGKERGDGVKSCCQC